jgi:acyl carrier protein
MSARPVIEEQIRRVARDQEVKLARLNDDTPLLESGLDSLCFAILVARLEDELGVDPFLDAEDDAFPLTLGALVAFYDRALAA